MLWQDLCVPSLSPSHQPLKGSGIPEPASGWPAFQCVQVEGAQNPVQSPLPWSRLGEGQERAMVESTSSTCPVPFPQVRARVIRSRNWEKEGWLGVGEGKPCPSAILYESQLLRRVRAPCPQPLELPSQSVCPARGCPGWPIPRHVGAHVRMRGLKAPWGNHCPSPLSAPSSEGVGVQ